jgi:hypothetical protein
MACSLAAERGRRHGMPKTCVKIPTPPRLGGEGQWKALVEPTAQDREEHDAIFLQRFRAFPFVGQERN